MITRLRENFYDNIKIDRHPFDSRLTTRERLNADWRGGRGQGTDQVNGMQSENCNSLSDSRVKAQRHLSMN